MTPMMRRVKQMTAQTLNKLGKELIDSKRSTSLSFSKEASVMQMKSNQNYTSKGNLRE